MCAFAASLAVAALCGEDQITYYPEYHGGLRLSFWLYPPAVTARANQTDDTVNFKPLLDSPALSLTGYFQFETPQKRVFSAEIWTMEERDLGVLGADTTWGGGTFGASDTVTAAARIRFWNILYGSTLVEKDAFEFGVYLGLDMVDLDMSLSSATSGGSMHRWMPTLTVGFNMWLYVFDNWGIFARMTGLSWTDLLGVEAGVFSPSGDYQVVEAGVVWRPAAGAQALLGYRRFLVRYDTIESAFSANLSGGFLGVNIEW